MDFPGALHHVMARGIERREIFDAEEDRRDFVARLGVVLQKTAAELFAWALMPNHIHLLLRTGEVRLGDVMRRLLGGYATAFNRRQGRCGHLFQNRFKSILVEEQRYLLELVRYIHLNPVRAGIVSTLEDLADYAWTGHRCLLGSDQLGWQDTDRVLTLFARVRGQARITYREFVRDGLKHGRRPELTTGQVIRRFGGRVLRALRRGRESWAADERILGSGDFVQSVLELAQEQYEKKTLSAAKGFDLETLIERVAEKMGLGPTDLRGPNKQRMSVRGRSSICALAMEYLGFSGRELSRRLEVSPSAVSKLLQRGRKDELTDKLAGTLFREHG